MASSNLAKVLSLEEATYGTTPAAAGNLMNVDSFVLDFAKTTGTPAVIRGDFADYADSSLQESGTASCTAPHQYGNTYNWWEAMFASDEAADYGITGTGISFTAPDTVADTGNGLAGLTVGSWFYPTGAGAGTNANKWFGPVLTSAAGSVTVPSGIATQAAGSTVNLSGKKLIDGIVQKSYSLEKDLTQLVASKFQNGLGASPTSVQVAWTSNAFANETWQFVVKTVNPGASATIYTGAAVAAPTSNFMNSLGDILNIKINDAAVGFEITNLQLTISANRNLRYAIATSAGASGLTTFRLMPEIQITGVWDTNAHTQLSGMAAHTTLGISWELRDNGTTGNQEVFTFPSCKPIAGTGPVIQRDTESTFTLTLKPFDNTTYGYMMGYFRKAA